MQNNTANLPVAQGEVSDATQKFVTFWIHDELFGVDILDVQEVTPLIDITPVFHAPDEVLGYVNIRGQIHLVLDMRVLMGHSKEEIGKESRIIIFKSKIAEPFGILIDKVGDVLEVSTDWIEPENRNINKDMKRQLVSGVCKLKEQLLILLDARKLLEK